MGGDSSRRPVGSTLFHDREGGDSLFDALVASANVCGGGVTLFLWLAAIAVGIWGVVTLISGQVLLGIVLIIVAFLIGPGGVSLFC